MSDVEKAPHFGRFLTAALNDYGEFKEAEAATGISAKTFGRWRKFAHSSEVNIRDSNKSKLAKLLGYGSWSEFVAVADTTPMPVPATSEDESDRYSLDSLVILCAGLSAEDRAEFMRRMLAKWPELRGDAGGPFNIDVVQGSFRAGRPAARAARSDDKSK